MSGMIFTFYSYKGGVGRSMALANIGVHFHQRGFRTLLIDMDLEAPGLERYFEGSAEFENIAVSQRPGFCDFIQEYLRRASGHSGNPDESPWPDIDDYITPLGPPEDYTSRALMLMHAGMRSGEAWGRYAQFVQTFDWTDFYERWEGGSCLEWLAGELRRKADVILIDSRTGVTEMGGVATQHLADAVIVLFGSNLQNVENSAKMAANFASPSVEAERGGRPLAVMAVPSRVDDQDSKGFLEFQKRYQEAFAPLPTAMPVDGYSMDHMCIPYLAPFSYREVILFGDKQAETSARRIVEAYTRIAANMQSMAPQASVLRSGPQPEPAAKTRVAILVAAPDETLAEMLQARLLESPIEPFLLGSRLQTEMDPATLFGNTFCAVAVVTQAFAESSLMRSLLQMITDMRKVIIPAIFQTVATMPLLLADKTSVDCSGDLGIAALRIAGAVEELRRPEVRVKRGKGGIFISYSQENAGFAGTLCKFLQSRGYSAWWDGMISPGANWQLEMEREMDRADLMLALVSRESRESESMLREWSYFTQQGKPGIAVRLGVSRLPLHMAGSPELDASSRDAAAYERVAEAVDRAFAAMPLSGEDWDRMSTHITNYLEAKGFSMVSFERIRKNINPGYSDELLMQLIDAKPKKFRRVILQGQRPGIGLIRRKAAPEFRK